MQAIFREIYWLRLLVQLQHKDMIKVMFKRASLALEAVALEIANHGESITLELVRSFSLCSFPQLANRPELISFI